MKYLLWLLLLPMGAPAQTTPHAQSDQPTEFKPHRGAYRVWVTLEASRRRAPGYLLGLSDTSITLATNNWPPGTWHRDYEIAEVAIRDVHSLKFRRRGRVGLGMLAGAVAGTVIGAAIGRAQVDPNQYLGELSVFAGGALGFAGGVVVGGALGSIKRKYRIHGDPEQWQRVRGKVGAYAF